MFKAKPHSEKLKFFCCRSNYDIINLFFFLQTKNSKKSNFTSPFPGTASWVTLVVTVIQPKRRGSC